MKALLLMMIMYLEPPGQPVSVVFILFTGQAVVFGKTLPEVSTEP